MSAKVISADAWRDAPLPLPVEQLRPLVPTLSDRAFRERYGNAFFLRSLNPARAEDARAEVTMTTIDPAGLVRSIQRQQWAHMVACTSRSTVTNLVSIGRTGINDIVINHASVSRFHAFVIESGPTRAIYDAGSRHGTFVDGVRVPVQGAGAPTPLRSCAVVRLGSVEMTFFDAAGLLASLQ